MARNSSGGRSGSWRLKFSRNWLIEKIKRFGEPTPANRGTVVVDEELRVRAVMLAVSEKTTVKTGVHHGFINLATPFVRTAHD